MAKRKSKKKSQNDRLSILIKFGVIMLVLGIIAAVYFVIYNNREAELSNLKTKYDSISIDFKYSDDCYDDRTYKIDFNKHDTFTVQSDATEEKYNSKRYILGSEDGKVYQKYLASDWRDMQAASDFVMPDTRVTRVLEKLKSSKGEKISSNDGIFVFGITSIGDADSVYQDLNSLTAFGNNWEISSYSSLEAKVYIERNGNINKIIFYPVGKDKKNGWRNGDYIGECESITWTFYDHNKTSVNYKEDLWNVIK